MNKLLIGLLVCILFANLVHSLDKGKHCKCRVRTDSRIVGGREARGTDYPWMVSLSNTRTNENKIIRRMLPNNVKIGTHTCGGVIVNEFFILTAAHCVMNGGETYVGYGNDNDLVKIYDAERISVVEIHIHPQLELLREESMGINDIALLRLESPIRFEDQVAPACLDKSRYTNYGQVMITGFGFTSKTIIDRNRGQVHHGEISRFLKELEYQDISNQSPKSEKYPGVIFSDSMTGEDESGCQGDSGGPMHKTSNGRTTVVGLTSSSNYFIYEEGHMIMCNGKAFYTRVSHYMNWIESIVHKSHC